MHLSEPKTTRSLVGEMSSVGGIARQSAYGSGLGAWDDPPATIAGLWCPLRDQERYYSGGAEQDCKTRPRRSTVQGRYAVMVVLAVSGEL